VPAPSLPFILAVYTGVLRKGQAPSKVLVIIDEIESPLLPRLKITAAGNRQRSIFIYINPS
jgi:hypothetical protein